MSILSLMVSTETLHNAAMHKSMTVCKGIVVMSKFVNGLMIGA